ncbi:MAG: DNA repair protein RecN [Arcobacter lacus]|nr:MAG: DNA repair protein RecN [Arcobacter lacus]
MSEYDIVENGVLFLDEIDANLSGKESESIAKLLDILSNNYQIFAISHQPQLTAIAHSHYLVEKNNNVSSIKLLPYNDRINEIARMISGKNITQDAINFATNILDTKK